MEPLLRKLVSNLLDFGWILESKTRHRGVTQTCLEITETPVQMHSESFRRLAARI